MTRRLADRIYRMSIKVLTPETCVPDSDAPIASRLETVTALKQGTRHRNQLPNGSNFRLAQASLQRTSSTGPTTKPQTTAPATAIKAEITNAGFEDPLVWTMTPARKGATIPDKFPMPFCKLVQRPAMDGPANVCVIAQ